MVGVRVGWGGPLSNPLEYGFWQLGFLHCLKPQASLGGAALCWARLFYESFFSEVSTPPLEVSAEVGGQEEQDFILLMLQSTQPRYADSPGLQAHLISQGGCLLVRGASSHYAAPLSAPHSSPA